jgi:hypothetical protein
LTDAYMPHSEWVKLTADQQNRVRELREDRDKKRGVGATKRSHDDDDNVTENSATGGRAGDQMSQRSKRSE